MRYFLKERKCRLQEEALDRAIKNTKLIEEQTGKTVDVLTWDSIYSLYGKEVEGEMMTRDLYKFLFRVIESPWITNKSLSNKETRALF